LPVSYCFRSFILISRIVSGLVAYSISSAGAPRKAGNRRKIPIEIVQKPSNERFCVFSHLEAGRDRKLLFDSHSIAEQFLVFPGVLAECTKINPLFCAENEWNLD
jgi:hypothetical protein